MMERSFIAQKTKEFHIKKYLESKLSNVGLSRIKLKKIPLGEKIIIYTSRPSLIVGSKGANIKELTRYLKKEFKLENPQVEINEIKDVFLDANVVAEKIAYSLERFGSARFKGIGHKTIENVMRAGALGVEIIISGKIPGARAKSWRFYQGYLKKCGDVSVAGVRKAKKFAALKSGIIGIKVSIMPADVKLPDKVEILDEPIEVVEEVIEEKGKKKKTAKKSTKKKSVKKTRKKDKEAEEIPVQEAEESSEKAETPKEETPAEEPAEEKPAEETSEEESKGDDSTEEKSVEDEQNSSKSQSKIETEEKAPAEEEQPVEEISEEESAEETAKESTEEAEEPQEETEAPEEEKQEESPEEETVPKNSSESESQSEEVQDQIKEDIPSAESLIEQTKEKFAQDELPKEKKEKKAEDLIEEVKESKFGEY